MKIKIVDDNITKLGAALDQANGHALKNVALVGDIFALADRAERSLTDRGLPIRERTGTEAAWPAKGPVARAYRYKMQRTLLTVQRGSRGWFLTGVQRISAYPQQGEHYQITISDRQRDRIVAAALTSFHVRTDVTVGIAPADGTCRPTDHVNSDADAFATAPAGE